MLTEKVQFTFMLFAFFQAKHFLSDFPLQREFMIRAKVQAGWGFVGPLALHCAIHASFTLAILIYFVPQLWWMAFVDFVVHFCMDRIKSSPNLLGRFNDSTTSAFWNCFGFDQMVHHLTHYFIIYTILTNYDWPAGMSALF